MATPKVFFRGELPAAKTVAYTVPAGKQAAVTSIVATNPGTDTSMVSVDLGGYPVLAAVGLHVNGVLTLEISQALNEGDTIEVLGNSTPAITHISGVEF
ncbi:hypothetical protein SEA_GOBY_21 [Streptomyces phage Goby]|uniref:Uncharacterized protein n=2 Tax=Likavirus TaxID=1982880 RepID=R4TN41_9CAUD|nr:hypothetical protein M183_gp22 [Streptomyces phage Zemlya]YP_010056574.1 hypothetical protein KGH00_gp21 [Streptomyces phage Goby]ATE85126.1 hypothetical protein SEA_DATTRAN_22 [Streptomyces phage Dattran]AWN07616.1 hypothetical protein SEA_TOMA_21 [Streptomyces phage Toma]AGM12197.1 hypothetical protein ZEMLYA_22 [Streptomyces phage Zemlya]AWN07540.1 hypothetical protein SEA_GOBY_21 [Streptomyces phage Goby]